MKKGGYKIIEDREFNYNKDKVDDIITKIKNNILNKDTKLPVTYEDLREDLEYSELKGDEYNIVNTNCHVGQRKLLLNEIQFYQYYLPKDRDVIVVYAGSADGHHTPMILDMFPKIKLLLIDPNYHDIARRTTYVYQNTDIVSRETSKRFNILNMKAKNRGFRYTLDNTEFTDGKRRDVLNYDKDEMRKVKDNFFSKDYIDLVKKIKQSDCRVFIIQDYFTADLAEYIKLSFGTEPIYFLSDIRTRIFDDVPNDLDVVWNYALQVSFLKVLKPEYSMLKFRPYFMIDLESDVVQNYLNGSSDDRYAMVRKDIERAKKDSGIDLFNDYLNRKCTYFQCDKIYLQPWAPRSSTEARMIIAKHNIDADFINYDFKEWENRFYSFNRWRSFLPLNPFYDSIKDNNNLKYDRCADCGLEIAIIMSYVNDDKDIDINKIQKSFNKETVKRLEDMYMRINRISNTYFFTSMKCLLPHNFTDKDSVNIY